jgi:hypothetical protein
MRPVKHIFNYAKKNSRSGAVVQYTRPDLTQKWINRIQAKANDAFSQEAVGKLSSLVGYYSKGLGDVAQKVDWDYWRSNIRTEGLVDKLKSKNQELSEHNYNVDSLAEKSVQTSEKYENYGLFLKYNYELWMNQYSCNLNALYGAMHLGDINMVGHSEMLAYLPGINALACGWRETGFTNPRKFFLLTFFYFIRNAL